MIIRKANVYDTNDIAKVHHDAWVHFYKHSVSEEFMEKYSLEKRRRFWMKYINDGNIVYVVEEKTGGILGFIVPKISTDILDKYKGEIVSHYVMDRFQHRGLGRLLFVASAKLFKVNKINGLKVWVHKDSPACEFYKRMGGIELGAKLERFDNRDIIKLCYVWDNLEQYIEDHAYVFNGITREI